MTDYGQTSQEYILQGSILDDSVDLLVHRLQGVTDDSDKGLVRFKCHEIVYSMRENTGPGVVNVRVRKHLHAPERPWTLLYLGNPEIGNKTTVRTYVEVNCTQNICSFLQELGFSVDFEFLSQGWTFRKNRLRASVAKISKIVNPNTLDTAPLSKSHFVEVSLVSSSSNEQASTEVLSFAEQLKPLVDLEKMDHKR